MKAIEKDEGTPRKLYSFINAPCVSSSAEELLDLICIQFP